MVPLCSISTEPYFFTCAAILECREMLRCLRLLNVVVRQQHVWNFCCCGTVCTLQSVTPTTSISGGEGRNENLIFFIGHWTSLDFIGHPTLNIGLGEALLWASTRARSLGQHIYLRRIITIQVYSICTLSEISKPFYSMTRQEYGQANLIKDQMFCWKIYAHQIHLKAVFEFFRWSNRFSVCCCPWLAQFLFSP